MKKMITLVASILGLILIVSSVSVSAIGEVSYWDLEEGNQIRYQLDTDTDDDGIPNEVDNYPYINNPNQSDTDCEVKVVENNELGTIGDLDFCNDTDRAIDEGYKGYINNPQLSWAANCQVSSSNIGFVTIYNAPVDCETALSDPSGCITEYGCRVDSGGKARAELEPLPSTICVVSNGFCMDDCVEGGTSLSSCLTSCGATYVDLNIIEWEELGPITYRQSSGCELYVYLPLTIKWQNNN